VQGRSAGVAVIGGSGFYSFLSGAEEVLPQTPWGEPSGPITIGSLDGRGVAFLPRHGSRHAIPPHRINNRANLWALRELGVRRVIAPCAAGSLQPRIRPGDFVVLDQLVDRTSGRDDTFVDGPVVEHVSFADPYCPEISSVLVAAGGPGKAAGGAVHPAGTVVVVQGPRFSTRAESQWFRSSGWDVVNMTQYPEAYLARELGLCYAGVALVTDYDTGIDEHDEPVTMEQVFRVLADNVDRVRSLISDAIPRLPSKLGCGCASLGAASLRAVTAR
jgi:5'-methylthioadenosine phosphorylase